MEGKLDLVQCPRCSSKVAAHNFKKHLRRAHSPEAERERARNKADLAATKAAEARAKRLADVLVRCPICKADVKRKNLTKHARIKHCQDLTSASAGGVEQANRFRSVREREAFFRARLGPQFEDESEDAFDRGKILNGGAFELGKGRKH